MVAHQMLPPFILIHKGEAERATIVAFDGFCTLIILSMFLEGTLVDRLLARVTLYVIASHITFV